MGSKQAASLSGFTVDDLRNVTPAVETAGLVVIGGQALNYWADFFGLDGGPHTSKDLDLQGDRAGVRIAAAALGTAPRFSTTPMDVVNAGLIETESDGRKLEINILYRPFGLDASEVADAAIPVEMEPGATVRVMHPFHVLVSRFANVSGLGRESEHDLRQTRVSVGCLAAMVRMRVHDDVREMLRTVERTFKYARDDRHAKAVQRKHKIDSFHAVEPLEHFPAAFREIRYPQMVAQLTKKRRTHGDPT